MTKEDQLKIKQKIQERYPTSILEYLGCNRFRSEAKVRISDRTVKTKPILFDENCEIIQLDKDYDYIFPFISGFAVVCLQTEEIVLRSNGIPKNRLDGMIDINGKEIISCIYDEIHIHSDGFVELTLKGVKKASNLGTISKGKYNWDKAIAWNH